MQIQCASSSAGKIIIVRVLLPGSPSSLFKGHVTLLFSVEEMDSLLCPHLHKRMASSTTQICKLIRLYFEE